MRCSTTDVLSYAGLSLRVLYHIWCEEEGNFKVAASAVFLEF